jgi:translation elongation factor EF-G
MGDMSGMISNKRGQLLEMNQEGDQIVLKAKLPVAEMFGLSNEIRSATSGRGNFFLIDQDYEKLPRDLQDKIINKIRERKGLKAEDLKEEGTDE